MTNAFSQLVWHSAGLAVACFLALTLFRLWRRRPVASYRAARAVVAAALVLPLAAGLLQVLRSTLDGAPAELALDASAPEETNQADRDRATPYLAGALPRPSETSVPVRAPAPLEPESTHASVEARDPFPSAAPPVPLLDRLTESWAASGVLRVQQSLRDRLPEALRSGATLVWVLGAALAVTLIGRRLFETRRLVARSRAVSDAATLEVWDRVRRGSPLEARVRLLESDELVTPASAGRATVLLPPRHCRPASEEALRCALLHELVHLERRDTTSSLLQQLFVGLFWFHPAAWWLGRREAELRELSCDELVVQRSGRPKRYAHALLEYANALGGRRNPQLVSLLSWASASAQLTRRIDMLIERRTPSNARARAVTAMAAAGVFGCLWSGQLAAASTPPGVEPIAAPAAVPAGIGEELPDSSPIDFGARVARPGNALAEMVGAAPDELLLVEQVDEGSVADLAGLEKWDVVTSIDREPATPEELRAATQRLSDGEKKHVTLRVQRRGEEIKLKVKLPREKGGDKADQGEGKGKRDKGRSRRDDTEDAGAVADPFAEWTALLAEEDRWATYDWLQDARRFLRGLDRDGMRELLDSTRANLGRALEDGHVPEQYTTYVDHLFAAAGDDLDDHLGGMSEYLAQVDAKDFRKQFLKSLDGPLKELRRAKKDKDKDGDKDGDSDKDKSRDKGKGKGKDKDDAEAERDGSRSEAELVAALRAAERRIEEQQAQIAELNRRLDALLERLER